MKKVILLSSDHEQECIGDVIVTVDSIIGLLAAQINNEFILIVSIAENENIKQWYKTKENLIAAMKEIIEAIGGDTSLADKFIISVPKDKNNRDMSSVISAIKEAVDKL
jgi:hypothetical protein